LLPHFISTPDTDKTPSNDNQILLIEVIQPNKTDALNYFAGSSDPPTRWARVVIVQSATEEAQFVNYRVGLYLTFDIPSLLTSSLIDWSIADPGDYRNTAPRVLLQLGEKLRKKSVAISGRATAMVYKHAHERVRHYTGASGNC